MNTIKTRREIHNEFDYVCEHYPDKIDEQFIPLAEHEFVRKKCLESNNEILRLWNEDKDKHRQALEEIKKYVKEMQARLEKDCDFFFNNSSDHWGIRNPDFETLKGNIQVEFKDLKDKYFPEGDSNASENMEGDKP